MRTNAATTAATTAARGAAPSAAAAAAAAAAGAAGAATSVVDAAPSSAAAAPASLQRSAKRRRQSEAAAGAARPAAVLVASATLLALLSAAGAPRPAAAACVFKQNCTTAGCHPWPVDPNNPNETTPFPNPGRACPQYKAAGCCTVQQDLLLYVNLLQIEAQFGDIRGGGCPGCFYNLRNFWCEYTCSPRQSDFVRVMGLSNMVDPTEPARSFDVLETRVALQRDFACGIFDSCERVKPVQQLSAMSNAEGFFAYQGQTEAIQHGAFIDFVLDSPSNASAPPMHVPLYSCCNFPDVDPASGANSTGNSSCPCSYCKGMCAGGQCGAGTGAGGGGGDGDTVYGTEPPWWNGFDAALVGGVWAAVLAVAIAHFVFTRVAAAKSAA
jgi:hypothetical protein